jgi:mono/diheme cytochrome c family protein
MDVYAEKHKPQGNNPTEITAANLTEGAKEYEEHCAFCHGGAKAAWQQLASTPVEIEEHTPEQHHMPADAPKK